MNPTTLQIEIKDAVATVWLNRAHLRNAFDDMVIAELTQTFNKLGNDDAVRVIVLAARGPAFCAGADLNWMQKMAGYTIDENRADASRLAAMLATIYRCPKSVVAQVQGDCYAGGMGLVAACDIAVASGTAHFCLSEVKIGLIPATIAPYVVRAMGERAAHRYFLTAERFSAFEAKQIGFVHEVVAAEQLEERVRGIVNALLLGGPRAVAEAKRLVIDVANAALGDELVADTVERIAKTRASDEGKEGLAAFLEKRRPGWLQD